MEIHPPNVVVATPERIAELERLGNEIAELSAHLEAGTAGWRRVDRNAENREAARQHKSRVLHVYPDEDGMVVVRERLTPEVGALLLRAGAGSRPRDGAETDPH